MKTTELMIETLNTIARAIDRNADAVESNTEALELIADRLRVDDLEACDAIEHDPLLDRTKELSIGIAVAKGLGLIAKNVSMQGR